MKRTPVLIDVNGVPLRESLSYNGGGAGFGGQMAEWLPPAQSADAALLPALRLGNARADDLVRNNGIAANAVRNRWFSVMAGPSVRVNEWFSAYAMAGVAYSRVSTFSGDYLRVTDNKGKTHDVLTGSDDGRHSNTSLAWGAGVQFNPTESVAIDVAYEGSGSGDWRTDGFIVGVGYKF